MIRAVSSSVVTDSRRSSSVEPGSLQMATATIAGIFILLALLGFCYTEFLHARVLAICAVAKTGAVYIAYASGFLLLGPQNYVFSRLKPGPPSRRLARSKSGAIVDESRAGVHDDLMRVPGKPLGFLAASTIEYHPARPEAHRSTVLAGQKLHSSRPPKPRELPVKVSLRHK